MLKQIGNGLENAPTTAVARGLKLLLEAKNAAVEFGREDWDFAVEIQDLTECGLTRFDLRRLMHLGFVTHATEVTTNTGNERRFEKKIDTFSSQSCFVICGDMSTVPSNRTGRWAAVAPKALGMPKWDSDRRQLRWGDEVIKQFRTKANNQETVLRAFEEEGWPIRIDDPLPPTPEVEAKRRLADTIKCLNRNRRSECVRFRGDGTAEGVLWEFLPSQDSGTAALPLGRLP